MVRPRRLFSRLPIARRLAKVHDSKDLEILVPIQPVNNSVGKMQDPTLSGLTFNSPVHQRISPDARDGILESCQETLLEARLALFVERRGFIDFLEGFGMKPV